jgi:hypothetical protein
VIDYIRYHLHPEQEAGFLDLCRTAAKYLESCPYCAELARTANKMANYILRAEWSGREAEIRESAEFRGYFGAIQRYLSSAVEVGEYSRLDLT